MLRRLLRTTVALFLLLVAAISLLIWRRPMTIFAWVNRGALASGGLKKVSIGTPVGVQTAFVGGQGPTLVFLHGAGDQAGSWSKVAPALTGRYRVLVTDLPGHGESAPPSGQLPMATLLAGTSAVLDEESAGQPVTIVGNSLGAWLAVLYARQHPERVRRLVLVNGGSMRANRPDISFLPANREQARRLFDELTDPGSPRIPDFVLDDIIRQANHGPIRRMADAAESMPEFVVEGAQLRRIKVPVDLLWGEADKVFTLDYAHRMESALPAARLTVVPRCGHVPQQECPLTFRPALEKLLSLAPPKRAAALSK